MIQPYAQQPWQPVWNPAVYGSYNSGASPWPAPVPAWPMQQTWQVNRTPSAPQTWQMNRTVEPVVQPRPVQSERTASPATDNTPYFVGGGLLGAAGLAAYMATQSGKRKKAEATEAKPPLLKLEDFKLNPGVDLSTVAKRHAMTQKIVDAVFPQFYEMYQNDFKNCDTEANTLFNTVLRRELCKDGAVKLNLSTRKEPYGQHVVRFQTSSLSKVLPNVQLANLNNNAPCFDLGEMNLRPAHYGKRSFDKEAFYSLFLHETQHLVYFLSENPDEYASVSAKFFRPACSYKKATNVFLALAGHKDIKESDLYSEGHPQFASLWNVLQKKQWLTQSPFHDYWDSALSKEILQVSKEQLLQEYKYYIKNELEAFTTHRLRFTQPGAVRGGNVNPEDLHDGIRALWLRELCRFYEEKLQLPPSEHTNLPITVNGVAFKD